LSPDAIDQGRPRAPVATDRPEHVKRVVAVASGKGGVGKSSIAVNLAVALARSGLRVGLMDADVYGPSAPLMLGLSGNPAYEDGKMVPLASAGLVANSIGLLVEPEQAMIWRGPMASQAITQLLTQTRWGTEAHPMDVLIVDLPPGTGDVQLTLVQKTPLDGAVIVSTPQEAALIDARRAVTLFGKTNTPVLGVVENMAFFSAPDGSDIEIFGRGGARAMAGTLNVPFLGEVPLDPALRAGGDAGRPLMATNPEAPASKAFEAMATSLRHSLGL
ncbi:MAG: Mrp/NBP35 family ATP-binding protein, partial [Asticcacaulis sp.]